MQIYIQNLTHFFQWLETHHYQYAVIRGHQHLNDFPKPQSKRPVVILVETLAFAQIKKAYPKTIKYLGIKCVLYTSYDSNQPYLYEERIFPASLVASVLKNRTIYQNSFFIPSDIDLYDVLLFLILYHKKIHLKQTLFGEVPDRVHGNFLFFQRLSPLMPILFDIHQYLTIKGYAPTKEQIITYLQNQAKNYFVNQFFAYWIACHNIGEMNMIVLRKKAVRKGFKDLLLNEISKHYEIVTIKDIPLLTRFKKSKYLRGNKWRFGGRPVIAVVIFDKSPKWRPIQERKQQHFMVFNRTQFFKRELREQIIKSGNLYHKDNALHTTDNESEAIAHLDLFFSPEEQQEIFTRVHQLREKMLPDPNLYFQQENN